MHASERVASARLFAKGRCGSLIPEHRVSHQHFVASQRRDDSETLLGIELLHSVRNGLYRHERYVAHFPLGSNVLMITDARVIHIAIAEDSLPPQFLWEAHLEDLVLLEYEPHLLRIRLLLMPAPHKPAGLVPSSGQQRSWRTSQATMHERISATWIGRVLNTTAQPPGMVFRTMFLQCIDTRKLPPPANGHQTTTVFGRAWDALKHAVGTNQAVLTPALLGLTHQTMLQRACARADYQARRVVAGMALHVPWVTARVGFAVPRSLNDGLRSGSSSTTQIQSVMSAWVVRDHHGAMEQPIVSGGLISQALPVLPGSR